MRYVLVLYYSRKGATAGMARQVARGVEQLLAKWISVRHYPGVLAKRAIKVLGCFEIWDRRYPVLTCFFQQDNGNQVADAIP